MPLRARDGVLLVVDAPEVAGGELDDGREVRRVPVPLDVGLAEAQPAPQEHRPEPR
jgi:hypothetical protein